MITIHFSNSLSDIIAKCKLYPLFDSFVSRSFLSWNIYIQKSGNFYSETTFVFLLKIKHDTGRTGENLSHVYTLFLCIYSFPVFRKRFSKDSQSTLGTASATFPFSCMVHDSSETNRWVLLNFSVKLYIYTYIYVQKKLIARLNPFSF